MVDGGRVGLRPEDDDFTQIFNMAYVCDEQHIIFNTLLVSYLLLQATA
jgi:hypothetical protein